MTSFIEWLLSWFVAIPGEDGLSEWVDDAHDSIDPQVVTRVYGGGFEKGEGKI